MDAQALHTALHRFLRRCDAESTRQAYERELLRFISWMPEDTHPDLLYDYRDHLRRRALGPTTVRWRMTVARAFLEFAHAEGYLEEDLARGVRLPKGKSGFVPAALTRAQLRRLLKAPDRRTQRGKRDAAILVCLGMGGLRAGEVCRLNREDVTVTAPGVELKVWGKGTKIRSVKLGWQSKPVIQGYLRAWPARDEDNEPLFWCGPRGKEGRRLTVAAVDYLVRTAAKRIGITELHAHTLRHTAATHAIESGTPLHLLRTQLGHASILTTVGYVQGR